MESAEQVFLDRLAEVLEVPSISPEDDFRSVNGQIEYLLTECVKQRKKNGKYVSDTIDEPIELDV